MGWSEIISLAAFILALVLAVRQIQMQIQDMRPYLSYSGLNGVLKVDQNTGRADMDFNLKLENVGKCVLRYEVVKFDIFISGLQLPEVQLKSTGSIIGVNTTAIYSKFYKGIWQYPTNLAPQEHAPPNYKVDFVIEYYRTNKPEKKYKLHYEIFKEFESGVVRELFGETFAD